MLQVAAPPSERCRRPHLLPSPQPRQQSSHPPITISVTKPSIGSTDSLEHHKYGSEQLPALAALASLAASAPAAPVKRENERWVLCEEPDDETCTAVQKEWSQDIQRSDTCCWLLASHSWHRYANADRFATSRLSKRARSQSRSRMVPSADFRRSRSASSMQAVQLILSTTVSRQHRQTTI